MKRSRTKKTKTYRREEPNRDPNAMSTALVLDARALEIRVRDLTKPLSLRQASPSRYVEREEPSSLTDAHLVLDRIQEMEQRQHWFEALLGGAGPDNDELESLRFKRLALEESQAALEQELKQVRRKMRSETSGIAPVHGNGKSKKQPCPTCSKLEIERTRLEGKELALQVKEKELQTKMQEVSMNERRVQEQQRQLEASRAELAAENDKFRRLNSTGGTDGSGVDEGSLAQREVALMRQRHGVWTARTQQQVELEKLEAARNQQQKDLRELEAARKALQQEQSALKAAHDLARNTQASQQQINSSEKSSLLRGKQQLEVERFRLNEERKELNSERRALETQRRELTEAQMALENRNGNQQKKCCFPLCCFAR